jgi:hypothetical protein
MNKRIKLIVIVVGVILGVFVLFRPTYKARFNFSDCIRHEVYIYRLNSSSTFFSSERVDNFEGCNPRLKGSISVYDEYFVFEITIQYERMVTSNTFVVDYRTVKAHFSFSNFGFAVLVSNK